MKYYIITGTSRGLGKSLAKQVIKRKNALFCISRTENSALVSLAKQHDVVLKYLQFDLSHVAEIAALVERIMQEIDPSQAEALYLINNAGLLDPVKPAGRYPHTAVITGVHVNLIAPMLLSSAFIEHTAQFAVEKRILNMTSGASQKPHFGWGMYCSTKAGLDMFTRCVGLEQQEQAAPVKIIGIAPGIVDTPMQAHIREQNKEDFPELERFVSFYEQGLLLSPDIVAETVIAFLEREDLVNGGIYDIRKFM